MIAAALNLQVVYTDLNTCNQASEAIQKAGHTAICIPKGEDYRFIEKTSQVDIMFEKFLKLIKELNKLETTEG
ncbi:uncharacterized protein METZ01_LOCUS83327 [marine metagenome]|uniref:Uncharacterized protein n=1 Tax=marine metagenome TaxID=408172 RepID=A0A381UUC0_9ZZZZ